MSTDGQCIYCVTSLRILVRQSARQGGAGLLGAVMRGMEYLFGLAFAWNGYYGALKPSRLTPHRSAFRGQGIFETFVSPSPPVTHG